MDSQEDFLLSFIAINTYLETSDILAADKLLGQYQEWAWNRCGLIDMDGPVGNLKIEIFWAGRVGGSPLGLITVLVHPASFYFLKHSSYLSYDNVNSTHIKLSSPLNVDNNLFKKWRGGGQQRSNGIWRRDVGGGTSPWGQGVA